MLDGVLDVGDRDLDLESDTALGELFDLGLHRAAILPVRRPAGLSLGKALLRVEFWAVP